MTQISDPDALSAVYQRCIKRAHIYAGLARRHQHRGWHYAAPSAMETSLKYARLAREVRRLIWERRQGSYSRAVT